MRTFIAVADAGRFQQAAADLSTTQQAVSRRVAALERDLARPPSAPTRPRPHRRHLDVILGPPLLIAALSAGYSGTMETMTAGSEWIAIVAYENVAGCPSPMAATRA